MSTTLTDRGLIRASSVSPLLAAEIYLQTYDRSNRRVTLFRASDGYYYHTVDDKDSFGLFSSGYWRTEYGHDPVELVNRMWNRVHNVR